MKIFLYTSFFFTFFFNAVTGQKVDSIKVEQTADLIKIHYKILNSNQSQFFRVTVYCSINGGLQSVIKSLSGDFGDNVIGGRSNYMVLWDVLKDVEEVKSVDFSVRAELMKDYSANDKTAQKSLSERKLYAFFVGGGPGPKLGGRIGYIGSWGITAMYLGGSVISPGLSAFNDTKQPVFSFGIDLTKRIVNTNAFSMHMFSGINTSKLLVGGKNATSPDYLSNCMGIEGGLMMSIKRFAFSLSVNPFPENWQKNGVNLKDHDKVFTYIGLGYRF
jgi:hypothetical protein